MLHGVEMQKAALIANLERLAARHAAQDVLMWGARGTGKSALVKSAVAHVQAAGGALALIEVVTHRLDDLSALFDAIAPLDRTFALFLDDLGFDAAGAARALRSLPEGGADTRPANARLVVPSKRRPQVPRDRNQKRLVQGESVAVRGDLGG